MPETRRRQYKIIKWIAATIIIAFGLLAATAWFLNVKSRPLLTEQIKTLLYKSTDSLYTISFSNVSTNVLTGSATLQNVKITADTIRFKELIRLKRAPNNLYTVTLKKLVVKHFHPITLYRQKKLQIEEVIFDKPEVLMMNRQFDFNENRPPRPIKSPYSFISKNLEEFRIDAIRFQDASFKYINKNVNKLNVFAIDDLNITLTDLLVDSTSADDPTRFYLLKDVIINLNDYQYTTPNKLYNIKLSKLDFRASTGKLRVNKFELEPRYDEMKFAEIAGHATDRFHIQMSDILMNGIDLPVYISKQELRTKEMGITNGFISVFNNGSTQKQEGEIKKGRFPHQLLQKLAPPVLIQKIKLKDVNISYTLYNDESKQRGRISFEHTSGIFKNVTNLPKIKAINPKMEVSLNTYLLGQASLDLNFRFDLNSPKGYFEYKGILHNFNARILNQITKPLGLVRINRGIVDKLQFDFKADNTGAQGKVDFYYYDLSVALMRNDPSKDHLVTRGLISILANALIINSENPNRHNQFISSDVNYKKPDSSSFFSLIWRSLYTGIKNSIGITEEKQNEIKQHIANFKEMRANHEIRKRNRLKRRQQKEKLRKLNERR
ncbi:hypothetical protein EV200_103223 [Pedobacter psychrotolerans]|uniref:AsmA-like protein n=1 Tax=Pedobacter psychrotolerans TaxID=1843235 RepID=A0A4R2HEP7_9SPHI|nr:hypothetical protein [Pedobacter psychrotolerans]TCO26891.1 hypothetical protein EV200_103223 [Pedobacter psychrotolerans]GGE57300.1 hypothetical protein GCM10011413_24640 [Pedobacter psychrotolerans]